MSTSTATRKANAAQKKTVPQWLQLETSFYISADDLIDLLAALDESSVAWRWVPTANPDLDGFLPAMLLEVDGHPTSVLMVLEPDAQYSTRFIGPLGSLVNLGVPAETGTA